MKNQVYLWSLFVLLILPITQAKNPADHVMTDMTQWMEATMVGRPENWHGKDDLLQKSEVPTQQKLMWQAYKDVAVRIGWGKKFLKMPVSVQRVKKEGIKAGTLVSGEMRMPYVFLTRGEKPADGWPMFICLHGGGMHASKDLTGPHGWEVNKREWQAQMSLTQHIYKPVGLYFIPRMAHDRWGRWWYKHNIDIFTRVIRRAILFNEVDPNKIYIMGISQGGYGTCHLAPFLADQFAAAGSMAGGMMTVTENLRNLPFRSDIGEKDTMYDRIKLAKALHQKIDSLKASDPTGYKNILAIQKGRGHGINYSLSPTWLSTHTRNPYPEKIVWRCYAKDGIYRDNFYWISLTRTPERGEIEITATLDKTTNQVTLIAEELLPADKKGAPPTRKPLASSRITVHLNDHMLNLDQEVRVTLNGRLVFQNRVKRSRSTMMRNLLKRGDINYAFPVDLTLDTMKK